MTTPATLTGQDIGRAHHATRAVLERRLAGVGLDFPSWVTLNALAAAGMTLDEDDLVGRVAAGLKVTGAEVRAVLAELAGRGLLARDGGPVRVEAAGAAVFEQVKAAIDDITRRLYGDLPSADLTIAHNILDIVTARADAELADTDAG